MTVTRLWRNQGKSTWRPRALALVPLAALLAVLSSLIAFIGVTPGQASTLTSADGYTTLSTIGTVTADTPYSSGQAITISGVANPVLSNANLVANNVPGQTTGNPTGNFSVEECIDPGGLVANLPTDASGCEKATEDVSVSKTDDGSFTDTGYQVYDLPDTNLGLPTMVGTCDVAPNQCVIGIFAADPQSGNGFKYPHLFSAPFNIVVGDGLDLGDNPGDGSAPTIAQTSAANSTVVASPATVVADGINTATVTVTLKDTNKNPVGSGKSVTLSQGSGHSTIEVNGAVASTGTTNANGQVVFAVGDDVAEPVTYTATDTTDNVTVTQTASVTFAAPVASAANSSIAAASSEVPQSGSTTVTVTLKDQGTPSEPITGKLVTLTQGGGHSTIAPASTGSDTTNAQGQATFTVSDTTAETVTYSATDTTDGIPLTGQSVSVTFGSLVVSPSQSTVTTTTPIVATSTSSVSQTSGSVDVTLLDGASPVGGKTVTLSSSSATAVVTPSSQTTGSNGVATFTVSDPTAETVTFKAVDTSDNNLALTATTQVSFQAPAVSASTSGMSVSPVKVPADGVSGASLTVTIEDQFGNPLAGKTVTVAGVVTGTSNPSVTGRVVPGQASGGVEITTTNGSGEITFVADDTTAESITYTATDTTDNVTVNQTQTVTFLAGVAQVSESTVQANPTSVPADGTSASTVTVTLEDHNQNPVPGDMVELTALNGSSVVAPASGVATNAAGQATFEVTDATSEVVRYRATDTTDTLPLVGEEVEVTFGTPPPTAPSVADSDVVASATKVPADGHSTATVEVILNDGNGLPLAGKSVALVPTSLHAIVSPSTAITGSNGIATFTVTDTAVESVIFTATDVTDNTPLTGLSVTISFTPAASVATSSAGASGGSRLNRPVVGMAAAPDGGGYWLVASDGGIFNYGDAGFYGSSGSIHLNAPVVGMAATPDGKGYWLVASDGGIFNYGDAAFYGSTGGIHLNRPIVGMAATPDGKGYWLVASDGGIFNYGDAVFYGSTGGMPLNRPVVGMAATADGKGYWLVASDGGIFNYGDAGFYGSTGSIHLNQPIVSLAANPDGKGYWLAASDGGIFNYGDAGFYGSTGSIHLNQPVVSLATGPDGNGYWLAASDGGIFNYGATAFYGSRAG